MKWKIYVWFAGCCCAIVDFIMWGKWRLPIYEYSYFLVEKGMVIWSAHILYKTVKYWKIDFEDKIRVRKVIVSLVGLYLIRILWEVISMIKGYHFMLREDVNDVYLMLILCYIGLTIFWINKPLFWKRKE